MPDIDTAVPGTCRPRGQRIGSIDAIYLARPHRLCVRHQDLRQGTQPHPLKSKSPKNRP